VTVLRGADSDFPQPALYHGREIWGVYVAKGAGHDTHIWTHEEVHELALADVRAVMPIVVPPSDKWWDDQTGGYSVLEGLARTAKTWGVVGPLCLDIEETPAEQMGAQRIKVIDAWLVACKTHGLEPWTYGGSTWHSVTVGKGKRWLARWPKPAGESSVETEIPAGYDAWQYAGNVEGGRIDLDLFGPGTYLGTDFKLIELPSPIKEPPKVSDTSTTTVPVTTPVTTVPVTTTAPTATEILSNPEVAAVNSAIDAQIATIRAAITDGNLAAAQATCALLATHVAELTTLLGGTPATTGTGTGSPGMGGGGTTGTGTTVPPEVAAIESAIDAQVASIRSDIAAGNYSGAQATAALLTTHVAELTDLLATLGGTTTTTTTSGSL
jgi:hypothetical protein